MCCVLVNMVCFYEGNPYIRTCNSDDVIHYSKHYKLAACTCTLLDTLMLIACVKKYFSGNFVCFHSLQGWLHFRDNSFMAIVRSIA